MPRPPSAVLLLASLAACAAPLPEEEEPPLPGIPVTVELLDPHFVRFEGRRIPLEAFWLEMRERVRAAGGDPLQFPAVTVLVGEGGEDMTILVTKVVDQLRRAGVRSIVLGGR
jgi:hypothetical protein